MSAGQVFVIGASGKVGKATINALAKKYGETLDIRAGVRNPEKVDKFNPLQGVTIVRAEMGKRDDLVQMFKDVDALFIVVPGIRDRLGLTRATAEAAREAGVKHILCIGSSTPKVKPNQPNQMLDIENMARKSRRALHNPLPIQIHGELFRLQRNYTEIINGLRYCRSESAFSCHTHGRPRLSLRRTSYRVAEKFKWRVLYPIMHISE